jgi:hypothetical protein
MIRTENSQWAHLIASLGEFSRYVRFTKGLNSKPYSFKAKISTCDIVLSEQTFELSNLSPDRVNSNKQVLWKMLTSPSCCYQLDFAPKLLVIEFQKPP